MEVLYQLSYVGATPDPIRSAASRASVPVLDDGLENPSTRLA